jgi:hypothetical protein
MSRLSASQIKDRLDELILKAAVSEPQLADRLVEFKQWIAKKKDGSLTSKRYVLDFLRELIQDSEFWLIIRTMPMGDRVELYEVAEISLAERYWLDELFPTWFMEADPKSSTWKEKMMSGEFQSYDNQAISQLERTIVYQGGSAAKRYILDLSMATDIVVVKTQEPLCTQITSITGDNLTLKAAKWEETLKYWFILRGLILSYSKRRVDYQDLAKTILECSDTLAKDVYTVDIKY